MVQVARLAPRLLGESTDLVRGFLATQRAAGSGLFVDRSGAPDLYYSVFGLDAMRALDVALPVEDVARHLMAHGDGEALDLVHLASLARCWAAIGRSPPAAVRDGMIERVVRHRTLSGGFAAGPAGGPATVYASFLAMGAYHDLGIAHELRAPERLADAIFAARTADGGWSGDGSPDGGGSTPGTAAALTLLRHLDRPAPEGAAEWLLARAHAHGGFAAGPGTPLPDLLSTATALHALAGLDVPATAMRERCLDFIDSLWTNRGSFHPTWADSELDCEYAFYGLLALGHLSVS
jgi:prenyltransferase beta subunit